MSDVCYGGNGQLSPAFVPALMRASAITTGTPYSLDAAVGARHWGLTKALLASNMNATMGKPISVNDFVVDNGVNSLRTIYQQDRNGENALTDGSCPPDVACGDPYSEFNTAVCKEIQDSFCIDDETMRRFSAEKRRMITVEVPGKGTFSMPEALVETFNTTATGLLRRLNSELWGEVPSIVGVNAVNGSAAPYTFNVTVAFFGNAPIDSGGQEIAKIKFQNAMGKMHIVGFGNFFNYVNSLGAARLGNIPSVNYFGTSQPLLVDGNFWFHADPLADTELGANQSFLFDDGKVQLITQNFKGSPNWKATGNFDPSNPATLTEWTPTNETLLGGNETLYFLMPVFAEPGLFLDVKMKRIDCVNGKIGNNGWQVTMWLTYGIYKIPSSFYSTTGSLAGTTKAILIETGAL